MTFADALNIKMAEKNLTPTELAKMSGVSRSYLSKLIHGAMQDPTWTKAVAIITALGMKPSEFLALMESDNA